jgi:hypothetical protein
MRIRIRDLFDPGSGKEKFGSEIRYEHPGSATSDFFGISLIGDIFGLFSTAISPFQILFVEIEFGAVFFIVSGTFFMWYNLGRR